MFVLPVQTLSLNQDINFLSHKFDLKSQSQKKFNTFVFVKISIRIYLFPGRNHQNTSTLLLLKGILDI